MASSGMLLRMALVRADVSEERRFLKEPHGVTSLKTAFFTVNAVKISNLTCDRINMKSVMQLEDLFHYHFLFVVFCSI
jgi:hypothetical protein